MIKKARLFLLIATALIAAVLASLARPLLAQAEVPPPILLVTSTTNLFTSYYAEILHTEGLNYFDMSDISLVDAVALADYDVVILGEMPLTSEQAAMFSDWVYAGGNLIAMRPDPDLAGLLSLTSAGGMLSNAYLRVETSSGPGAGIVAETIQFHGDADQYNLNGATALAYLCSDATTETSYPAVTLVSVGMNGGQAAAFTYDLARSVVYTRQGNPAWAGDDRDASGQLRPNDMFYGAKVGDVQPDWVDLTKVAIPQADEQQHLLANMILEMDQDRMPLPRFWYFPRGEKAVIILTSDGANSEYVDDRFEVYKSYDPAGCVVENWECVRSGSDIYPSSPLTNDEASTYTAQGFEVGLHVNTYCSDYTAEQIAILYTGQLAAWQAKYTSIPAPDTERTHCVVWNDWTVFPEEEVKHGSRLDTNYYYWPQTWVANQPGMFTGSGMPMHFAKLDGTMIDVYQAVTQMTDESGQSYPYTVDTLLDRALGPEGYYGAFTVNVHISSPSDDRANAIITSALEHGVPVVSGRQMLEWLDGRDASTFEDLAWSGNTLTFSIAIGAGARGLQAMLPTQSAAGELVNISRSGSSIFYQVQTVKGVEDAVFEASAGPYAAAYAVDSFPPAIVNVNAAPGTNATATISWDTDEASTSQVVYGTVQDDLTQTASSDGWVTAHQVMLNGLAPNTTYYYRVGSADEVGNEATYPVDPAPPLSFTTTAASLIDTTAADFGLGTLGACAYVAQTGDGEVILAPMVGAEFSGSALPDGWFVGNWWDVFRGQWPSHLGRCTRWRRDNLRTGALAGVCGHFHRSFPPGHRVWPGPQHIPVCHLQHLWGGRALCTYEWHPDVSWNQPVKRAPPFPHRLDCLQCGLFDRRDGGCHT